MLQTEACSSANWAVEAVLAIYIDFTGCHVSVGLLQVVFNVLMRA